MKYHELKAGANRSKRRVGRGIAAGRGKTAGRGTKGQGSRTGFSKNPGFEGGQNPLMQRLPKLPGFKSHRQKAENVSLSQIASLKVKSIDAEVLSAHGLITNPYVRVKLLSGGAVDTPLTVKLPSASASAVDAIEKAGGEFIQIPRLSRPVSKKSESEPGRRINNPASKTGAVSSAEK